MTTPGLEDEDKDDQKPDADPQLYSLRHFVDVARSDDAFRTVAKRYTGDENFDTERLVRRLIEDNSVPYLPAQRYTDSGRRRREEWERAWRLQDREDDIDARTELDENHPDYLTEQQAEDLKKQEVGDIDRPPKYRQTDYQSDTIYRNRGKLDVPSERFHRYPGCAEGDGDDWLVSWAGYDHRQRALALAARYHQAKEDGWIDDPDHKQRLAEMLAGIQDLLFWVKKWHPDPEPTTGQPLGDFLDDMITSECNTLNLSPDDLDSIRLGHYD